MDDLDRKILTLLAKNARMPVKEIAEQVSLTSPAVSSRIHKLETDGIISGYTVTLNRPADRMYVDALISLSVAPSKQDAFLELLQNSREVLQCYHVTGAYTFLVKVSCGSMAQLEHRENRYLIAERHFIFFEIRVNLFLNRIADFITEEIQGLASFLRDA